MNPKIGRNFEVFSPCDFIARIIPPETRPSPTSRSPSPGSTPRAPSGPLRPWEWALRASNSEQVLRRAESNFLSVNAPMPGCTKRWKMAGYRTKEDSGNGRKRTMLWV